MRGGSLGTRRSLAVADLAGGAIIATTDSRDLKRLAAHATRGVIADIR